MKNGNLLLVTCTALMVAKTLTFCAPPAKPPPGGESNEAVGKGGPMTGPPPVHPLTAPAATTHPAPDPNGPTPIAVGIGRVSGTGGTIPIRIDGRRAEFENLAELLSGRKHALAATQPGRGVLLSVTFDDVGSATWEQLRPVLAACAEAQIGSMTIQGVPYALPARLSESSSSDGLADPHRAGTPSPGPDFLPMLLTTRADVDGLRARIAALKNTQVVLACSDSAKVSLILDVLALLRKANAQTAFAATGPSEGIELRLGGVQKQKPKAERVRMRAE